MFGQSNRTPTSRPAWAAGAQTTGRPQRSGGSRSSSSPSGSAALVGVKNVDPNTAGPGESGRMDRILDAGFKQPAGESVLIQSSHRASRRSRLQGRRLGRRLARLEGRGRPERPVAARPGQRGPDLEGRALGARRVRDRAATRPTRATRSAPILDEVDAAKKAHPGYFIGEFGDASAMHAVDTAFANDLVSAGALSIPLTLIILIVAFGALVAAGIPLLLALTAVFATFGLIALPSHILPIAQEAPAVVLLVGLAVGVDYAMFYLRREREERASGKSERAALEAAAATSGRSVLISGLTVMVAMAGMFLTGDATFASFGLATMMVVAIAMLGSLTVLPALLSRLGDGVDRLQVPLVGRLRRDDGEGRIWGAVIDRVLKRPVLSAALSAGFLVAAGASRAPVPDRRPGHGQLPAVDGDREDATTGCRTRSRARRSPRTSSSRRRT